MQLLSPRFSTGTEANTLRASYRIACFVRCRRVLSGRSSIDWLIAPSSFMKFIRDTLLLTPFDEQISRVQNESTVSRDLLFDLLQKHATKKATGPACQVQQVSVFAACCFLSTLRYGSVSTSDLKELLRATAQAERGWRSARRLRRGAPPVQSHPRPLQSAEAQFSPFSRCIGMNLKSLRRL